MLILIFAHLKQRLCLFYEVLAYIAYLGYLCKENFTALSLCAIKTANDGVLAPQSPNIRLYSLKKKRGVYFLPKDRPKATRIKILKAAIKPELEITSSKKYQ